MRDDCEPSDHIPHAARGVSADPYCRETAQASEPVIVFSGLSVSLANQVVSTPPYSLTLLKLGDDKIVNGCVYSKDMADASVAPSTGRPAA
jgi:hypothetical protein